MRYLLLVLLICLAVAFDLGVYIAMSDDTFESFDPLQPATILPIAADRLREIRAQAREVLREIVKELAVPYRDLLPRRLPTEPLPQ